MLARSTGGRTTNKKTRVENAQMRAAAGVRAVHHLIFLFVCVLRWSRFMGHGRAVRSPCACSPWRWGAERRIVQSAEMCVLSSTIFVWCLFCSQLTFLRISDFGCCPMGAHVQCLWVRHTVHRRHWLAFQGPNCGFIFEVPHQCNLYVFVLYGL